MQEKLNLLQLQTALNIKHIARSLSVWHMPPLTGMAKKKKFLAVGTYESQIWLLTALMAYGLRIICTGYY